MTLYTVFSKDKEPIATVKDKERAESLLPPNGRIVEWDSERTEDEREESR